MENETVFNQQTLDQLRASLPAETLQILFSGVRDEIRVQLAKFEQPDITASELQFTTHALAGMCGNYGLSALGEINRILEELCRNGEAETARAQIPSVLACGDETLRFIEENLL